MKTVLIVTVTHKNEIPDLLDKVAGRAYTLDGVQDVTAEVFKPHLNLAVREMRDEPAPPRGFLARFLNLFNQGA